jgi:ribosomal protein S18 acetylase RimI-like enzyme
MRIREFNWPEDYNALVSLWQAADLYNPTSDGLIQMREVSERNPGLFLLVDEPGRGVVGGVIGAFDGRRGYIYHVAVHPDFRRKGYATALMREVEKRIWARGAHKIRFMVKAGSEQAVQFYRTLGFEVDTHAIPMSKSRPAPEKT